MTELPRCKGRVVHPLDAFGLERLPPDLGDEEAISWLASHMARAALRWDLFGVFLRFKQETYRRTVLFRSLEWEFILACWLPGQKSQIHDHGGSSGVVLQALGSVRETRFDRCVGSHLQGRAPQDFLRGDVMIERPGTIHQVENATSRPAVTLHLYSPPLERMNPYPQPLTHQEAPSPQRR